MTRSPISSNRRPFTRTTAWADLLEKAEAKGAAGAAASEEAEMAAGAAGAAAAGAAVAATIRYVSVRNDLEHDACSMASPRDHSDAVDVAVRESTRFARES